MGGTSSLGDLPAEVVAGVVSHIQDRKTLKACRLTFKALLLPATRELFQTAILWPTDESAERAECILDSEANGGRRSLSEHVRCLVIYSSNHPEYENSFGYPEPDSLDWEQPESYFSILRRIDHLVNLRSVHVIFSKECAAGNEIYSKEVPETVELRKNLLIALFKALEQAANTNGRQLSLTIENLQNENSREVVEELPEFHKVLSNLVELHLGLCTEYNEDAPETSIDQMEMVNFFQEPKGLRSVWLEPTQNTIKRLSLHCDVDWGFIPQFNPSKLFFPNLQFLSLGNWIYSRNSDLKWIHDHRATLEELTFANCAILFHVSLFADHLYQHHPVLDDMNELQSIQDSGDSATTILTFDTRWYQVFDKLRESLLNLKHFQMMSLVDQADTSSISVDYEFAGQTSSVYINQIRPERYAMFDSSIGPSQALREEEGPEQYQTKSKPNGKVVVVYDNEFDPNIDPSESHWSASTACYDLDTAALEQLLFTIRKRATEAVTMEST